MKFWLPLLKKLAPIIRNRWTGLLAIAIWLLCLAAGKYPYWGDLELAAKSESTALNVTLEQPWTWQHRVELTGDIFRLEDIIMSDNPFVERNPALNQGNAKPISGTLTIRTDTGRLFLNQFFVPAEHRVNIATIPEGNLTIRSQNSNHDKPSVATGKLTLVGSGEVCLTPSIGDTSCHPITPSTMRPDAPRTVYFSSAGTPFNLTLPTQSMPLFTNQRAKNIGFWQLGIAKSFESSPFECSLQDGVLIFTVQNQSLDLWRTNCIDITGNALALNAAWSGERLHSRIRGKAHTNHNMMPSTLQAFLVEPWISDMANTAGWIIALLGAVTVLLFNKEIS